MAKKRKFLEYHLQVMVCDYLELQYSDVPFLSDTVGNIKLTMGQAVRNKKIQKDEFKCPDILILCPNKKYHGLFIELKKESPFKESGELYSTDHLKAQQLSIDQLNSLGYYATFSWDFEMAKDIIDTYLYNR